MPAKTEGLAEKGTTEAEHNGIFGANSGNHSQVTLRLPKTRDRGAEIGSGPKV